MLSVATLRGMWAGLPVAWTEDDRFDEPRYRRNVRRTCQAGAHGAYTHGSTGEFYAQTFEEWLAVARATLEEAHACGVPVQIGVTDLATRQVIRKMESAAQLGADAVQTALPFWMPLSQAEAVGFFADLARAVPGMPIVLYATGRAKTPITPELLRRALDAGVPLIGCKYTGPVADIPALVRACPEISFLVGEADLATGMAAGARGSCSAYIYVCPQYMLRYYALCEAGAWEAARAIEEHIKAWHAGPCQHLFAKGMQDSALDRTFAHAAGFIEIELRCRPPYVSASQEDLEQYIRLCREGFSEFLYDTE
jgi:dihydrodipicolinate synthase/N-acetylneuraminate lyase